LQPRSSGLQPLKTILVPTLAALVGIALLVGLGVWQVQRLAWKEALIARVTARLHAPAIAAPGPAEWPHLDLSGGEYQPVAVSGRYAHDREIHVVQALTEPRGRYGGYGYLVMTPLTTADGWIVYVNRGFVPQDKADPSRRKEGQVEGEVKITGLLRAPYRRSWFMPADNTARNEWFSREPALYARANGLPAAKVAPYIIDAFADPNLPGGLPQGGETIVDFPNNHLQYAITWFALAAGLAGVSALFVWGRLRKPTDRSLAGDEGERARDGGAASRGGA
jgi:surfeit locus 1 family protein